MEWDAVAYLKGRHTKQLLDLRDSIYRVNAHSESPGHPDSTYTIGEINSGHVVTLGQVKAELANREHVPNKEEAKFIRQMKAKAQRNH